MISAKEEPEAAIPPAMDGLLKVHQRILDDIDPTRALPGGTICTRLLLAATQAGNLIGKQGATIKTVQDSSNCIIRVLGEGLLDNTLRTRFHLIFVCIIDCTVYIADMYKVVSDLCLQRTFLFLL